MSETRETGFKNAKAGDRCYSPLLKSANPDDKTNGVIITIYNQDFQVEIKLENPIKEIPVRPKRMVKKKGFIGISICRELSTGRMAKTVTDIYNSAERVRAIDEDCTPIPIEFEVEE